jgi:ABC-type nitrate/sulfonate/bicarbonate transport system substrate-binding protein
VKKTSRPLAAVASAAAGVLLLGACGSGESAAGSTSITIGISPISVYAAGYETKGCLADKGYQAEFAEFSATPDRLAALVNGSVDMAFAGFTDTIKLSAKGAKDLAMVSNAADGGYRVVASRDSGLTTIGSLAGKTIAVPSGTVQEISLRYALKQKGIDPDTGVSMVQMAYADMPVALQRGDVDAFVGTAPYPAISVANGGGVEIPLPDLPWEFINSGLVTTHSYLGSNPAAAQAVVDCLQDSTTRLTSNPDELRALFVDKYKVPEEAVDILMQDVKLTTDVSDSAVQGLIDTEFDLGYIETKPALVDVLHRLTR